MVVGVCGVERPCELGPAPPDQPEHDDRAHHGFEIEMMSRVVRDLRDREHEDKVKEQLNKCCALVVGRYEGDGAAGGHGRKGRCASVYSTISCPTVQRWS